MDPEVHAYYRSSPAVIGEGVYQFLRGGVYGAIWSLITPFPPNTSKLSAQQKAAAIAEANAGVYRPAPPFSSLSTLPSNVVVFATILGVQRVACKSLELVRRREDIWNEIFGFAVTYRYHAYFLGSTERRLVLHNRIVGGAVLACVFYANFLV